MISQIGSIAISLAGGLIFSSFIFLGFFKKFKNQTYLQVAERAILATSYCIFLAFFCLLNELLISNFNLQYVAQYTSYETPVFYKVTALWAGQAGSLLFWSFITALFAVTYIFTTLEKLKTLKFHSYIILSFIFSFFILLSNFIANPFEPVSSDIIVQNGNGLNPLLQNFFMAIHPPILYVGFTGSAIIFIMALAASISKDISFEWVQSIRRWSLFVWTFLSAGIILGGYWAYNELGWGGYWAWDPVENASLFPWLTGTAYLHSILIQEKKNMLKGWNIILIMLTFTLTIFGTYLTRSGIISSIHAFAATDLGIWFFGFIVIIVVFNIVMLYLNKDILKSQNKLDSVLSRESGFLFNNMLFVAICIAVLWGTMYPVISEAFTGTQITLGPSYFNKVIQPFGVILVFLTGVGPLLSWRKTSVKSIKRNFTIPIILSAIMTLIWLSVYKVFSFYPVMFTFLVLFVIIVIIFEFQKAISARRRTKNENFLNAFKNLINKNRTRYGGYIVHLAIMIMTIGFIGKAFDKEAVIPVMFTSMFRIGEETGELSEMITKLADFYEDEVSSSVKSLTSIMEPLMIIFVAVFVGIILIAMYLPMFSMMSTVG